MKSLFKKVYRTNKFARKTAEKIYGNKKKIIGINNKISTSDAFMKHVNIVVKGNNNEILIGTKSNIANSKIYIKGNNHKLIIGDECVIRNGEFWFEDNNCELKLGNKTSIEGAHIAVTEPDAKITIGEDCMFSDQIDIRNGDSHSILDIENGKRINYAKDIFIGNHVWVGKGVQILKGVSIGSNSIVGTRSIVTKDVPNNSIATGTPAKVVKTNVTWDRQRIYS